MNKSLLFRSSMPTAWAVSWITLLIHTTTSAASFENRIEQSFPAAKGGKLVLRADRGTIRVSTGAVDRVEIQVTRTAVAESQEKADEIFADHQISFVEERELITVEADFKGLAKGTSTSTESTSPSFLGRLFGARSQTTTVNRSSPDLKVAYEVTLPHQFNLDLKTAGGNVMVADLAGECRAEVASGGIELGRIDGPVQLKAFGGSISLTRSTGPVEANGSSGDIRIGEVQSDANVHSLGGSVRIEKVAGELLVQTASGNLEVEEAVGKVAAKVQGGSITIGTIRGDLRAEVASGSIRVDHAGGDVQATALGGSVHLKNTEGKSQVKVTSGNIEIDEANGPLDLVSQGGSITVRKATAGVKAASTSGAIRLEQISSAVQAKALGGNIDLGLIGQPEEACRLESTSGSITLTFPSAVGFNLEAQASGGRIKSDFPLTDGSSNPDPASKLKGQINGGGPVLYLRSTGGDVRLRKGE